MDFLRSLGMAAWLVTIWDTLRFAARALWHSGSLIFFAFVSACGFRRLRLHVPRGRYASEESAQVDHARRASYDQMRS
jgi:hypothetical protein